ncbi:FtsX-like permease family protein [Pseudoalteromonas denitrificans]|uniref:Putative ABC transport system permease protein n=1 Tax=Pseudoalteromonas denitrificans DSM 6059 TaxID=1123010 RepID=A0A1I1P5F5_9GAMM|nr:FtsX-like permease family protein [Pseudoalteromonas denitrificans]SFD05059.1 putative ABC transport system permease protein [Pseudoalteromonas denitrificans DSM 6059]
MFDAFDKIEFFQIIQTQIAEYKYNKMLNLGFITSLGVATCTLLSTLILNHASKQQYEIANEKLESPIAYYVVPKKDKYLSVFDFKRLRLQGFIELNPVLSFQKKVIQNDGSFKSIQFKAIDLLVLTLLQSEFYCAECLLISEEYEKALFNSGTIDKQSFLKVGNGTRFELVSKPVYDWGNIILLDIAFAWQLFPEKKGYSYLIVNKLSNRRLLELENALPKHLKLEQSFTLKERAGFADALHLNLLALAVLGFIVSLFIAFQSANQAWCKRSELMMQLRLLGISVFNIRLALLFEAVFLILIASAIGFLLALLLVSLVLPLLGFTLSQLYNLKVSGHFEWDWQYFVWSLMVSSVAVIIALFKQLFILSSFKVFFVAKQIKAHSTNKVVLYFCFFAVLITLIGFILLPQMNWQYVMLKYAFLLISTVFFLPLFIKMILWLLSKITSQFKIKFIIKDVANQVARRFLPLAAFYLALTASIAAALMVNSFEEAFTQYLDQHLNEDLYIRSNSDQTEDVESWLKQSRFIDESIQYYTGTAKMISKKSHQTFDTVNINTVDSIRQLGSVVFKSKNKFANFVGQACFINEQLSLKRDIYLNSTIHILKGGEMVNCQVNGIYFDYGNPHFEVTLAKLKVRAFLNHLNELSFGVYLNEPKAKSIVNVKTALIAKLELEQTQIHESTQIKKMALDIFNQTFLLTKGISMVMICIACFGLFLSANNLELARKPDLLILLSLGYSKKSIYSHMLIQWLLLTCICIVLSWPIAIVLAHALVSQILPASFGWSMPLILDVKSFGVTSLACLICLFPALFIPIRKINLQSDI